MTGRVVFLGRTIPACAVDEVNKNIKNGMMASTVAFQEKLISGFDALCEDFVLCNVEAIESFPQHYSKAHISSFRYSHRNEGALKDYNVGFNNTSGIRQLSICRGVKRGLLVLNKERKIDTIVVYSTMTFFLNAAMWFKKHHPGVKICLIIPDLPDFETLSEKVAWKNRLYQHLQNKMMNRVQGTTDLMVLLTEQMADYLGWRGKYVVVEGIAEEIPAIDAAEKKCSTIVYTGTTHKKFGLPVLVQAVMQMERKDVELVICGCGDYDDELRKIAQKDSRIRFLGIVPHKEALRMQMSAAVLVNPRQNNEVYTKYSFPSKTMEYLSTGNPVIAYRLDGIPQSYLPYLHCPRDDTPESLADEIEGLLSLPEQERYRQGQLGKEYVLTHKNAAVQVGKITQALDKI